MAHQLLYRWIIQSSEGSHVDNEHDELGLAGEFVAEPHMARGS